MVAALVETTHWQRDLLSLNGALVLLPLPPSLLLLELLLRRCLLDPLLGICFSSSGSGCNRSADSLEISFRQPLHARSAAADAALIPFAQQQQPLPA